MATDHLYGTNKCCMKIRVWMGREQGHVDKYVTVEIDYDKIADQYGDRAHKSKGRKSVQLGGGVVIYANPDK